MKSIQRITLSETATSNLKQVAIKAGLSPNVVARFAMLASFEQGPLPVEDTGKQGLTINQSSLFGELEAFLLAAFYAATPKNTPESQYAKHLASHVARGAAYLNLRVADVVDLVRLCHT